MNPHTTFLIWIHYIFAWLVGFPAICGTLFFGWQVLDLIRNPTPPMPELTTSSDGMVQIFNGVERGLAFVTRPIAILGEGIIKGLFTASVVGLVFAAILYFTGRGLSVGSGWARVLSGSAWLLVTLIGALSLLTPANGLIRLAGASVLLFGGYGLWVLTTGFKLK